MANKKKFRVNPFNFILLKRMLEYEFVRIGESPNRSQLIEFIYNKHKSPDLSNTYYTSKKKDSLAYQRAERLRKYILAPQDFLFSEEMLDHFAQEISVLDSFSCWKDFVQKYGDHPCAQRIDSILAYKPFDIVYEEEAEKIKSQTNLFLYHLHLEKIKRDGVTKHTILSEGEFVIRRIDEIEIKDIQLLAERLYPCPINKFDIKKPWFEKNPNIFFVYKDYYDLWGNLNLLPIKDQAFKKLKAGQIYESEIKAHDIHSPDEKELVKFIYVEGFACAIQKAFKYFISTADQMIDILSKKGNKDLVICAIGGSTEGDRLMKKCGFEITSWSRNPKTGEKFPFYECKWLSLLEYLKKKDLIQPLIVSQKRLTQYKKD